MARPLMVLREKSVTVSLILSASGHRDTGKPAHSDAIDAPDWLNRT